MDVYYKKGGIWAESRSLWKLLASEAGRGGRGPGLNIFKNRQPFVISFVGAGGKTTLIRRIAQEAGDQGLKVLVTTTTHMFRPSRFGVFSKEVRDVERMLLDYGTAVVGEPAGEEKIRFPGQAFYRGICPLADLVLVEADGSRGLPLKVPGAGEPAVPENTDLLLCLGGLSALGRPGDETAFRLEQVKGILSLHCRENCGCQCAEGRLQDDLQTGLGFQKDRAWLVTPEIMGCLMQNGYLIPMRNHFPAVTALPVFNQADTPELLYAGKSVVDIMGEMDGLVTGKANVEEGSLLF